MPTDTKNIIYDYMQEWPSNLLSELKIIGLNHHYDGLTLNEYFSIRKDYDNITASDLLLYPRNKEYLQLYYKKHIKVILILFRMVFHGYAMGFITNKICYDEIIFNTSKYNYDRHWMNIRLMSCIIYTKYGAQIVHSHNGYINTNVHFVIRYFNEWEICKYEYCYKNKLLKMKICKTISASFSA